MIRREEARLPSPEASLVESDVTIHLSHTEGIRSQSIEQMVMEETMRTNIPALVPVVDIVVSLRRERSPAMEVDKEWAVVPSPLGRHQEITPSPTSQTLDVTPTPTVTPLPNSPAPSEDTRQKLRKQPPPFTSSTIDLASHAEEESVNMDSSESSPFETT